MPYHSSTFIPYYFSNFIFATAYSAIVLLSLAALLKRNRKRSLIAAIETMAWIVLVAGVLVSATYIGDAWIALFNGNKFERFTFIHLQLSGVYGLYYGAQVLSALIVPQLFWFRRMRRTPWISLLVAALIFIPQQADKIILDLTLGPFRTQSPPPAEQ